MTTARSPVFDSVDRKVFKFCGVAAVLLGVTIVTCLAFMDWFWGSFAVATNGVARVASPSGRFVVTVDYWDKGALGESTQIYVTSVPDGSRERIAKWNSVWAGDIAWQGDRRVVVFLNPGMRPVNLRQRLERIELDGEVLTIEYRYR